MTSLLWQDSSCYVSIVNKLNQSLILSDQTTPWGHWQKGPTAFIMPNHTASLYLKYDVLLSGSEGTIGYTLGNNTRFNFTFGSPGLRANNYANLNITSLNPESYDYTVKCKSGGFGQSCLGGSDWQYDGCPLVDGPTCIEYTVNLAGSKDFFCDFNVRNFSPWRLKIYDWDVKIGDNPGHNKGEWLNNKNPRTWGDALPNRSNYVAPRLLGGKGGSEGYITYGDGYGTYFTLYCRDLDSRREPNAAEITVRGTLASGYTHKYLCQSGDTGCVGTDTIGKCPDNGHPVCVSYEIYSTNPPRFSVSVTIQSRIKVAFTLVDKNNAVGTWNPPPPDQINPSGSDVISFNLTGNPVSQGYVVYRYGSSDTLLNFSFSDFPLNNNYGRVDIINSNGYLAVNVDCSAFNNHTTGSNCPNSSVPIDLVYNIYDVNGLSSYVMVQNAMPTDMVLQSAKNLSGQWEIVPPKTVQTEKKRKTYKDK